MLHYSYTLVYMDARILQHMEMDETVGSRYKLSGVATRKALAWPPIMYAQLA